VVDGGATFYFSIPKEKGDTSEHEEKKHKKDPALIQPALSGGSPCLQ
jgi:hypothetical protein